jgi:dipeptidyl aminopeptidase/acylaminoacyl peptidase
MLIAQRVLTGLIGCMMLALAGCFSSNTIPVTVTPQTSVVEADAQGGPLEAPPAPDLPRVALSIAALREAAYPGSDFVIEQALDPGINYNRYIASYLSDGLKINALLTVPQGQKPPTGWPVVIFNHGYIPPDEYRTTERYVAYVDAFARNGYLVVKSDYRGHGDSEGEAGNVYGSPGYTIDVLNALASARRYPDADPNRVGMWGHSMGGYITLRAMVANQGIKAGVIWAGVVASYGEMFRSWFGPVDPNGRPGWRTDLVGQFGTPADNPAFWNSLSANAYLSDLSGPIQIHHGTGDTTVPYLYSTLLEAEIEAAGKQGELFLYDGDDHNIATHRDDALALSVAFFHLHVRDT